MDLELLQQATKKVLTPARWEHTLRVVDTAVKLAHHEGVDPQKAEIAATLHDYCKFWSADELIVWIKRHHLPPDLLDYNSHLWHAPVGAEVARLHFGIRDEEILDAIRYHTSARPQMSQLEKIIYLADYMEPGRQFPGVEEVRELANIDLEKALLQAIDYVIISLIDRRQKIYPLTLEARNDQLHRVMQTALREESI
jgi:predicted HD superfamily hydrolase involved in NAD metabolism